MITPKYSKIRDSQEALLYLVELLFSFKGYKLKDEIISEIQELNRELIFRTQRIDYIIKNRGALKEKTNE